VILTSPAGLVGERLPRRLAAGIIDTLILVALSAGIVLAAARAGSLRGPLYAAVVALWFVYFIAFERLAATTPGKRLLGLYVATVEDERAELIAHVIRGFTRIPEAVLVVPYLVLIHGSPRHQRLGDTLSNTVVVRHRPYS
jgi:uncharacterized RDD family membrane protein YckC